MSETNMSPPPLELPAAVPPERLRRPRVSLWIFRITVLLHLLVVISQPITIGQYLTGKFSMLAWHSGLGSALAAITMLMGVAALAYVLAGGRVWVVPLLVVLFLAEGLQIGMGYARVLTIHVPLGVFIVTASILLFIWLWLPSAKRGRGRRKASTSTSGTSTSGTSTSGTLSSPTEEAS